ncbi:sigma factor-like helix-turn-helix DNA-binding protein [Streptomyces sp. NPDC049040]|uniref:sigma factor-like helix-turn-helix DNA-binding protein n=1 Tax=Streptomyces sp. NPDC049040 TaxID=3365593 RepID=UPI00371E4476
MGKRRAASEIRRDAEFAAFSAGAAGRLLHTATLLTGDREQAERLLTATLASTYADWLRMRADDPYDQARAELVRRFAYRPWWRRPRGGVLARLTPQERLVVTMRYFEGVAEEQTAAQLGLPAERVRAIGARATAALRSHRYDPAGPPPADGPPPPGGGRGAAPGSVAEARDRADRSARRAAQEVAP